ncbi:hypothetical protein FOL47_009054 [Perkinsus chesapeaki]|uniref:Sugar phosphate transporter domain-containing protein n=1 Tax=Perkinsus chesapeaki TaxID=330153 RepID=A0A7J6MSE0_PERCH|nr:hypothetical protein FOL47_009054 [Perkinsus chesapeaki]
MTILGYTLKEALIIAACFASSLSMMNSVKYIQTNLDYPYPLFISAMHMLWSFVACGMYLRFDLAALKDYSTRKYLREIVPIATFSSASISCGNLALKYIYPSFNELLQQTSAAVTVIVGVLIFGKRYNLATYISMLPVCGGAFLCGHGEVNFVLIGALFAIGSVFFRALKNTMQGNLLSGSFSSLELLFALAPANLIFFLVGSVLSEGLSPVWEASTSPRIILALVLSSALACAFNLLTFMMLKLLSPVGAMVVHSLKTPGMLITSWALFGNPVRSSQILGFVIITAGVYYYKTHSVELTASPESPIKIANSAASGDTASEGDLETSVGDVSSGCTDLEIGEVGSDSGLE